MIQFSGGNNSCFGPIFSEESPSESVYPSFYQACIGATGSYQIGFENTTFFLIGLKKLCIKIQYFCILQNPFLTVQSVAKYV